MSNHPRLRLLAATCLASGALLGPRLFATGELMDAAKSVRASEGAPEGWPAAWATDTLLVAHDAFKGLSFKPTQPPAQAKWIATYDNHTDYLQAADAINRKQLAKGGARLAELLNAIWP